MREIICFSLGCVLPSFLHRVQKRFTLLGDTCHHLQLLKQVLHHRNQNMTVIHSKIKKFYSKMQEGQVIKLGSDSRKKVTSIKFDSVSKMHFFTRSCILTSYKAAGRPSPRIVFSSLPKIMSRFYTKRSVIRKVKTQVGKNIL